MGCYAGVARGTKNITRTRRVDSTSDEGEGEEAGHFSYLDFKVLNLPRKRLRPSSPPLAVNIDLCVATSYLYYSSITNRCTQRSQSKNAHLFRPCIRAR